MSLRTPVAVLSLGPLCAYSLHKSCRTSLLSAILMLARGAKQVFQGKRHQGEAMHSKNTRIRGHWGRLGSTWRVPSARQTMTVVVSLV